VKAEPSNPELLPLSLLNDFLYCQRRAALKVVEGWREFNQHTERGDIVHEHADLPGYEVAKGVTLLRALPVWSERLGLNGKCDIVEVHPHPACVHPLPSDGRGTDGALFPVEFKLGKRRKWENDDAELCAQALCLEEMFGCSISRGAIFHADSKRRREVEFTAELRQRTEDAARQLHELLESESVPLAEYRDACQECSLFEICLPKATGVGSRAAQLAGQLFKT
jgi:CRISPR-associated exonuclease Cas4